MQSTTTAPSNPLLARQASRHVQFDTDSVEMLIDNGASHHIWKRKQDFVTYRPLTEAEKQSETITGIAGQTCPEGIGTVKIVLEDNEGGRHKQLLENTRYLPSSPICIFVPQEFAQQGAREGDQNCHCDTRHDGIILEWTAEDHTIASKFIPLSASNVGITRTAPGFDNFNAYAALFNNFCQPVACPATVSDDEGDSDNDSVTSPPGEPPPAEPPPSTSPDKESPHLIPRSDDTKAQRVNFKPTSAEAIPARQADEPLLESDEKLLMEYHERLGHLSFDQLRVLAAGGLVPKKLIRCRTPKFPRCLYGKAHRRPW